MKFNGMNIVISKPFKCANQKLSDGVTVTDQFRDDFNQWLLDFFGFTWEATVKDGEVIRFGNNLMMTEATRSELFKNVSREHLF
ncbi:MAG: hypothetical protein ACXWT4_06075 [Methylobacter sp.]